MLHLQMFLPISKAICHNPAVLRLAHHRQWSVSSLACVWLKISRRQWNLCSRGLKLMKPWQSCEGKHPVQTATHRVQISHGENCRQMQCAVTRCYTCTIQASAQCELLFEQSSYNLPALDLDASIVSSVSFDGQMPWTSAVCSLLVTLLVFSTRIETFWINLGVRGFPWSHIGHAFRPRLTFEHSRSGRHVSARHVILLATSWFRSGAHRCPVLVWCTPGIQWSVCRDVDWFLAHGLMFFGGCEVVIKSRAASNHETESKVSQVSQVVVAEAVLQDSHVADAVQLWSWQTTGPPETPEVSNVGETRWSDGEMVHKDCATICLTFP